MKTFLVLSFSLCLKEASVIVLVPEAAERLLFDMPVDTIIEDDLVACWNLLVIPLDMATPPKEFFLPCFCRAFACFCLATLDFLFPIFYVRLVVGGSVVFENGVVV